jgi:hypothetical protein
MNFDLHIASKLCPEYTPFGLSAIFGSLCSLEWLERLSPDT